MSDTPRPAQFFLTSEAESRPSAAPHEVICQDCQGRGWNLSSDDKEQAPCESCVGQPCEYEERVPKSADWTACRSAKTPGKRYCSLHEEIAKFNKKYPGYKVRRAEGAAVQPPAPTVSSEASWEERYRAVRDVMPKWVLDHICEVLEVADDHLGKDRDFVKTFIASHERQCAEITRLREAAQYAIDVLDESDYGYIPDVIEKCQRALAGGIAPPSAWIRQESCRECDGEGCNNCKNWPLEQAVQEIEEISAAPPSPPPTEPAK